MKDLIIRASEILEDKFNIIPVESKLFLHENIDDFLKNLRSKNAKSVFLPSTLSAHAPNNQLDCIVHEYFGHGTFCEHSKYGKMLVENERKFQTMSKKELGEALFLQDQLYTYFEGHALWTEDFLLRSLDQEEILNKRLESLKNSRVKLFSHPEISTQEDIYNIVKSIEKEHGSYELWYTFGFLRQLDKTTLINIAKEKLKDKFNNLQLLIHFGSKNPESDIDLCAILDDNYKITQDPSHIIDFAQNNYSKFLERIEKFDPPITEALLTGEPIYGDINLFNKLKEDLLNKTPNEESIKYLSERSKWCLNEAENILNNYPQIKSNLKLSLSKLAYSISCLEFAKAYFTGSKAIQFKDIDNPLLNEIRTYMKSTEINQGGVNFLIQKTKQYIQ